MLANQATEFEYNKNRTEGKTGVVKPDLIPSKNIQKTLFDTKIKSPDEEVPLKTIVLHGSSSSINTTSENELAISEKTNYISPTKIVQQANEKPPMKITPETSPKLMLKKLSETISTSSQNSSATDPTDKLLNEEPDIKKLNQIAEQIVVESDIPSLPEKKELEVIDKFSLRSNQKNEHPIHSKTHIEDKITAEPDVPGTKNVSLVTQNATRPSLRRTKKGGTIEQAKPPNILVYSDSNTTKENVISTLRTILEKDVYTIYPLATNDVKNKIWIDNATLLVVCGNVPKEVGKILLDYFLHGGKMLCLCSDVLHIVLSTYRMAEVYFLQHAFFVLYV